MASRESYDVTHANKEPAAAAGRQAGKKGLLLPCLPPQNPISVVKWFGYGDRRWPI